jgi:hypothetical protein
MAQAQAPSSSVGNSTQSVPQSVPRGVPETALTGITLHGLDKLETKIKEAYESGHFREDFEAEDGCVLKGVECFEDLTTDHLTYM